MPPRPPEPARELPPTAGQPLGWRDLLAGFSGGDGFAPAAARFLGVAELLVTCSGTAALVVALTTLRRHSSRRKVLVPGFTCPLVAIAVAHCGLELVTCDLAADGIDMDEVSLARQIGPDILAVIPTHLAGRVTRMEPVLRLAAAHGVTVIEDAAQALGAHLDGQPVGTLGDIGFYSLAVGKGLTLFEGGLLYARDAEMRAELATVAAALLPRDRMMEVRRGLELAAYALVYRPALLPLAYGRGVRRALGRGDAIGAAGDLFGRDIPLHDIGPWRQGVGASALKRLPGFLAAGRDRAVLIRERLAAIQGVSLIQDPPGGDGVWPSFLLRLRDKASRDRALSRLWGAGLGVSRLLVHALTDYPFLADIVPYTPLPRARRLAATSLLIGNSPWLTETDLDRIEQELRAALHPPTVKFNAGGATAPRPARRGG